MAMRRYMYVGYQSCDATSNGSFIAEATAYFTAHISLLKHQRLRLVLLLPIRTSHHKKNLASIPNVGQLRAETSSHTPVLPQPAHKTDVL